MHLTSTTAPGKVFDTRKALADHYKSDWHRYNLKRKEAGLNLVTEDEFTKRLEAARALKAEQEARQVRDGKGHLKKNRNIHSSVKKEKQEEAAVRQQEQNETLAEAIDDHHQNQQQVGKKEEEEEEDPEQRIIVDPYTDLFDVSLNPKNFKSVKQNVQHMQRKYGFFIPDVEYLTDLEGLIGYCAEKINLGHVCLYCQRVFPTVAGCKRHMLDSSHSKLKYEQGIDLHEFEPFYDFKDANDLYLRSSGGVGGKYTVARGDDIDKDDEAEWEDMDSEEMEDHANDGDDDLMNEYVDGIRGRGFGVTALGELILPDGRIVGHRSLSRYYKQQFSSTYNDDIRLVTAKKISHLQGKGILVADRHQTSSSSNALVRSTRGLSNYTALSVYRYKAAMKKAHKEEFKGRKKFEKYYYAINKMDKKANRLMNGVSVAHAAR